jgi:hypothetical protein
MSHVMTTVDLSRFDTDTPDDEVLSALGLSIAPPEQIVDHDEVIETLRGTLCRIGAHAGRALRELAEAHEARRIEKEHHERFKVQVREKAKEVADEQGWCRPGLNAALGDLGLDPFVERYEVTVLVTAIFEVTGSEDVETEEDADHRVRFALDGIEYSGCADVELTRWEVTCFEVSSKSDE